LAQGGLEFAGQQAALGWLEAERANLLAAVGQAVATPGVPAELGMRLAQALYPADLTEKWADDFRELAGVLVIGRVRARGGGDSHTQAPAESARDLGEDGKAVLADEQAHGHGNGRQGRIVGQVQLVGPKLDPGSCKIAPRTYPG